MKEPGQIGIMGDRQCRHDYFLLSSNEVKCKDLLSTLKPIAFLRSDMDDDFRYSYLSGKTNSGTFTLKLTERV